MLKTEKGSLHVAPALSHVIYKSYNLCRIVFSYKFKAGLLEIRETFEIVAQMAAHLKYTYTVSLN